MTKAWSVIASTAFLVVAALLIFPWPKLPSWAKAIEPPRRIELPCKPHPSLLYWWNHEYINSETDYGWSKTPASLNVEYWYKGKKVATRREAFRLDFDRTQPYVSWRAVLDGKAYITLANPTEEFKRDIQRCESLPVVFD